MLALGISDITADLKRTGLQLFSHLLTVIQHTLMHLRNKDANVIQNLETFK